MARSLRDRIENNIIIALVVAGVSVGTTTAGVVTYLNQQQRKIAEAKLQSEIDSLRSRIAAIDRSLGGKEGDEKLDVRKMMSEEVAIVAASSNPGMKYFPERHYCASVSIEGLHYEKSTEGKTIEDMTGTQLSDTASAAMDQPIDIWKGDPIAVVGSPFKYLFPFIEVIEISNEKIATMGPKVDKLLHGGNGTGKDEDVKDDAADRQTKELSTLLKKTTSNKSAAFYAMSLLTFMLTNDIGYVNVRRIEQVGPIFFNLAWQWCFHGRNDNPDCEPLRD